MSKTPEERAEGIVRANPSAIVPFIPGERHIDRHRRRVEAAKVGRDAIREWCEHRGVEHIVCGYEWHPHGLTFKFRIPFHKGAAVAGWIPGLARAWRVENAGHGEAEYNHVHDWRQLVLFLEPWADAAKAKAAAMRGAHA